MLSQEYQRSFDLCVAGILPTNGPVAIVAGSCSYALEILRRLHGHDTLLIWEKKNPLVDQLLLEELETKTNIVDFESIEGTSIKAITWAMPDKHDGRHTLRSIANVMEPGGYLSILTPCRLSILYSSRVVWCKDPDFQPAHVMMVKKWLRQQDMLTKDLVGINGLHSILWGSLAGQAARFGRPDLADRCYFEMREELIVTDLYTGLSALSVIVAQKPV